MRSPSPALGFPLHFTLSLLSRSHTEKHNINQYQTYKLLLFRGSFIRSTKVCVCAPSSAPRLGWNSCLWLEGKLSCGKLDFMLSPSQEQCATLRQSHPPPCITAKLALPKVTSTATSHLCHTCSKAIVSSIKTVDGQFQVTAMKSHRSSTCRLPANEAVFCTSPWRVHGK